MFDLFIIQQRFREAHWTTDPTRLLLGRATPTQWKLRAQMVRSGKLCRMYPPLQRNGRLITLVIVLLYSSVQALGWPFPMTLPISNHVCSKLCPLPLHTLLLLLPRHSPALMYVSIYYVTLSLAFRLCDSSSFNSWNNADYMTIMPDLMSLCKILHSSNTAY